MTKKVLVTGGAGFIGSEFVRVATKKGLEIIVIDNLSYAGDLERINSVYDNTTFYNLNITDKSNLNELFKKEKPEAIVHFAAETHVDRSIIEADPFIETNVKGTQVLLDIAKNHNIQKFINISTDEVYGELEAEGEFFETTPLNPNSPYSVSKASADMLGRAYFRTYGLPVTTVRPSNNYGAWQYPEKLLPVVIIKALANQKIPVYGKGENIREWLHVSDCVEGIFQILDKGKVNESYNLGSNQEKQNIEVVKYILKLLGKSEELIEFVKDRLGHDFRYSLNTNKINTELGWQPKVTFENGIENTVQWYIDNKSWLDKKLKVLEEYWKIAYKK